MSKDIDEMENMLNDYLQFAKSQIKENTEKIKINEIFFNIQKAKHQKFRYRNK